METVSVPVWLCTFISGNTFPDIEADVYLEQPKPIFDYIDRMDEVKTEAEEEKEYDLLSPVMSAHWIALLLPESI